MFTVTHQYYNICKFTTLFISIHKYNLLVLKKYFSYRNICSIHFSIQNFISSTKICFNTEMFFRHKNIFAVWNYYFCMWRTGPSWLVPSLPSAVLFLSFILRLPYKQEKHDKVLYFKGLWVRCIVSLLSKYHVLNISINPDIGIKKNTY